MCLEVVVGPVDTKSGLSLCYMWELISRRHSHLSEVLSRPGAELAEPSSQSQMGAAALLWIFSASRDSPLMPGISPTGEMIPPCSQ